MEEYTKNSIISFFLIISMILMPLSFIPRKAEATNINTIVGGLTGVITQLPLCQGSVKSLFSSNKGLDFSTGKDFGITGGQTSSSSEGIVGSKGTTLSELNDLGLNKVEAIPVDVGKPITTATTSSAESQKSTAASSETLKNNDTCLKSIGRVIIKMLLQKITTDTVKWINGGMDGSPLFVQDPGQYFKDIAETEILGMTGEINDPTLYPFGQAFIQAQARSFTNKFANNARYSLDKMIQDTNPQFSAQTFNRDFSQGGWGAWDALTQNPANNPLGFTLMASNELAKRIENSTNLATGSLQQSGGYLGVEKCREPSNVTKKEDFDGRKERALSPIGPYQHNLCTGGFYFVTPGQMVASAATKTLNYPDNNLLNAQDLNDAVAAILDALLGSFSSSFMSEGGFAGLSDTPTPAFSQGSDGSFVINNDNTTTFGDSGRVGQDYSSFVIASSSFLSQNPNFNIRTDLNQALIDEQRIYQDKIIQQNKELESSDPVVKPTESNGYFTGNHGLIPTIYQLDYCIPGPHPGFEQDSRAALNAALGVIVPETTESIKSKSADEIYGAISSIAPLLAAAVGAVLGATVLSAIPVIGTVIGAVLGAVIGYVVGILSKAGKDKKIRMYYLGHLGALTGIFADLDKYNIDPATTNKGPFDDALNKILDRYIQIIYDVFTPAQMPRVTDEATQKYLQTKGYMQMFKNDEERIVAMDSIISRLNKIKAGIDDLNNQIDPKNPNPINIDAYETGLRPFIEEFGRISQEMVAGDDIAIVDNTIKQIIDEKNYVYNVLLKGPNGCEKDLENAIGAGGQGSLPSEVYATKRMEYPGPILYDYNNWNNSNKATLLFPDPFNSGYKDNKMNGHTDINVVGPGFLSYVTYEADPYWCSSYYTDDTCHNEGSDRNGLRDPNIFHVPLIIHDLFPLKDFTTHVGFGKGTHDPDDDASMYFDENLTTYNGLFEFNIGVY